VVSRAGRVAGRARRHRHRRQPAAASGLGTAPTPAAFARYLTSNSVFCAFEQVDPAVFRALAEGYARRYAAGQSEGDIQDALTASVARRIRRHMAGADNDVLVDYANLMADQYAAIGAKDARARFIRLTKGATPAQADFFGPALKERESMLQERALRSAAPRTAVPRDLLQADYVAVFAERAGRYTPEELALFGHAEQVQPAQYPLY
jgi:hypothetical protein